MKAIGKMVLFAAGIALLSWAIVRAPHPAHADQSGFNGVWVYGCTQPATPVTSANIAGATVPAGFYRASYYSVVTTSGVGGTSFSLNLIYTDKQQAQTIAAFTNSTFTAGNVNQGTFYIQNQAAAAINYSVTEAGTFTTHPVVYLCLALERLQ